MLKFSFSVIIYRIKCGGVCIIKHEITYKYSNEDAFGFGFISKVTSAYWKRYLKQENKQYMIDIIIEYMLAVKRTNVAFIESIFVSEEERNQGLGTAILEDLIEEAKKHNATVFLIVDTLTDNTMNLVDWYKGFNFKLIDISKTFPIMILKNGR